ncbi:MAG: rhomboid family intramembrane serine protease [Rhodobacteraceae bacterium]|nr:rhomboid family intramembrane serine protease [Paracoccaceae bacterium]
MDFDHNAHPLNPLPGVVWLLVLPIALIEITLSLGTDGLIGGAGAVGWRLQAMQDYAFSPPVFQWMLANQYFPAEHMIRFVSYMFIHGNPTHAIFVVVFLMALGKYVSEVFRPWAVLVLFFASGIMGAVAFGLLSHSQMVLIGGYPAVYGLIGGFSFILWTRLGQTGGNRSGAFSLIGFFLGAQLLFGLVFGGNQEWIADLAGFVTGFGLSFLICPGGIERVLDMIRRR